jgi:hypothetical protein
VGSGGVIFGPDDYDPSRWQDDLDDEDEELRVLGTMSDNDAELLRRHGFMGTGDTA